MSIINVVFGNAKKIGYPLWERKGGYGGSEIRREEFNSILRLSCSLGFFWMDAGFERRREKYNYVLVLASTVLLARLLVR